ncbi:MAG: hypothetical protein U0793_27810 [Gemmataceae bacterium]
MRRCKLSALVAVFLIVSASHAQDEKPAPGAGEADPALADWQWLEEVRGLEKADAKYYAIDVPPSVFAKARPDLWDLRLADAGGVRIPYAKRELRPDVRQDETRILRRFDEGTNEAKRYVQVSLELGDPGPEGHNEIEIATSGANFRRRLQVLGSDNEDFKDALSFLDRFLVRYDVDDRTIDIRRLHYDFRRFRFLQVRVYADPATKEDIPKIERVTVRRSIAQPGVYYPWTPAQLGPVDLVRADGSPGSAWHIDFGEKTPCEKLRFEVFGDEVDRPMRLQIADPQEPRLDIAGSIERRWHKEKGKLFLELDFPEVVAQRLRLIVTDYANPPLQLGTVEYTAPVRRLIFSLPNDKKPAPPLRLYFGNLTVPGPPNYDIERRLPQRLDPPPTPLTLGERTANPAYQPPPPTLSERAPWLIYVALAAACLALFGVLLLVARKAMAQHDAEAASRRSEPGQLHPDQPG